MKKYFVLASILALLAVMAIQAAPTKAGGGDCRALNRGNLTPLDSLDIDFTCGASTTVYFGACDSGNVPNDDLFNITFMGSEVSNNYYLGDFELVNVGQAQAAAGAQIATLNSLNTTPFPPATYSYAISPDQSEVTSYLAAWCGTDFTGTDPSITGCLRSFPVFTTDTAPSAGTLKLNVLFGTMNREEGATYKTWNVTAGQRINNDMVTIPTPRWVRLWWQPTGSTTWYLLPSQYWLGDGTPASEYGLTCGTDNGPSYHTSFANAIPASEVPAFHP